jgi:hypothetical protein
MLPHFTGPYRIDSMSDDGNFASVTHFLDKDTVLPPVHVSRLLHFDGSRTSRADLVDYQLEPGSYVVDGVIEHRQLADGSHEFHIRWQGTPITTWLPSRARLRPGGRARVARPAGAARLARVPAEPADPVSAWRPTHSYSTDTTMLFMLRGFSFRKKGVRPGASSCPYRQLLTHC